MRRITLTAPSAPSAAKKGASNCSTSVTSTRRTRDSRRSRWTRSMGWWRGRRRPWPGSLTRFMDRNLLSISSSRKKYEKRRSKMLSPWAGVSGMNLISLCVTLSSWSSLSPTGAYTMPKLPRDSCAVPPHTRTCKVPAKVNGGKRMPGYKSSWQNSNGIMRAHSQPQELKISG